MAMSSQTAQPGTEPDGASRRGLPPRCAVKGSPMKYELWHSESEGSYMLFLEGNRSAEREKARDARVIWTAEAISYSEAIQKHDRFLGLSSLQSAGSERVTMGMYLDEDGNERSVEVPGWVGVVPRLVKASVRISAVLGQVYVERPCRDLTNPPGEITVVELRSTDGRRRMFQVLDGQIGDLARIREIVPRRLGTDIPSWTIVATHVSKPGVWWSQGEVHVVDQRLLPSRHEIIRCRTLGDVALAIRTMQVCRMPEIASAAGYGMALVAWKQAITEGDSDAWELQNHLRDAKGILDATRPEDLALSAATNRIFAAADAFYDDNNFSPVQWPSSEEMAEHVLKEAHSMAAALHSTALVQREFFKKSKTTSAPQIDNALASWEPRE